MCSIEWWYGDGGGGGLGAGARRRRRRHRPGHLERRRVERRAGRADPRRPPRRRRDRPARRPLGLPGGVADGRVPVAGGPVVPRRHLAHPEAKRILRRGHAAAGMPVAQAAWRAGRDQRRPPRPARPSGRAPGGASCSPATRRCSSASAPSCRTGRRPKRCSTGVNAPTPSSATTAPNPSSRAWSCARDFDGAVAGRFVLDPIGGATVAEALRRIEAQLYRHDKTAGVVRRQDERMAAALVEMAVRACTPKKRGRRPEPLVLILAGEATVEHLCELAPAPSSTPASSYPISPGPTCRRSSSTAPTGSSPRRSVARSAGRCAGPSRCATATASTPPAVTPRSSSAT